MFNLPRGSPNLTASTVIALLSVVACGRLGFDRLVTLEGDGARPDDSAAGSSSDTQVPATMISDASMPLVNDDASSPTAEAGGSAGNGGATAAEPVAASGDAGEAGNAGASGGAPPVGAGGAVSGGGSGTDAGGMLEVALDAGVDIDSGTLMVDPEPPVELVSNGDFAAGDAGFSSELSLFTGSGSIPEGEYIITDSTSAQHHLVLDDVPDHGGDGMLMMVNSAREPDVIVWQQQVTMLAGITYRMTVWIRHWDLAVMDPFDYELLADGTNLGQMLQEAGVDGSDWTRLTLEWMHDATGDVTVGLVNTNLAAYGNDHLLDDFSLIQID